MLFDFQCEYCDLKFEAYINANDEIKQNCPKCSRKTRRLYTTMPPDFGFKPYTSEHMIKRPGKVYIDSRSTEKRVMKENGILGWNRLSKKEI